MNKQNFTVCISGAGLVGSLLAVYLAKKGIKVDVYEGRPDMRCENISAGRSINLALSDRGWKGLAGAGLDEKIREIAIPMKGRLVHTLKGDTRFLPYGKKNQAIYSVSRGELNKTLITEAEKFPHINFYFNQRTESINTITNTIQFKDQENFKQNKKTYDLVFGADGAYSAIRNELMKIDRFDYCQEYIKHAYKELSIPADKNNCWKLEKNALHIWPRKSFMLIALPNLDGSFTVTLFLAFEGSESFENLQTAIDVEKFFKKWFPDALSLIPDLTKDFFTNPTSSLLTVRCKPWYLKDKICLIGDAAHAIVPFFGQGMNAGFEDCTLLNQTIEKYNGNWEKILKEFSDKRKADSDAIAELALNNFIEMRDLVDDPEFLLQNKIEKKLSEFYPDKWKTLYSMVTFSHIPYSEALSKGKAQRTLIAKMIEKERINDSTSDDKIKTIADKYKIKN